MGNYEREDLIKDISAALRRASEKQVLEIHRGLYGKEESKEERKGP